MIEFLELRVQGRGLCQLSEKRNKKIRKMYINKFYSPGANLRVLAFTM